MSTTGADAPHRADGDVPGGAGIGATSPGRDALVDALLELRADALALEERWSDLVEAVPADDRPSARNLVHYAALRNRDIRELQRELAVNGVSALADVEPNVLAAVDAVLRRLGAAAPPCGDDHPSFTSSLALLERHTTAALGPRDPARRTRLMVTLPTEAAVDAEVTTQLVDAGIELVRINCAHDGPAEWLAMARQARAAADRSARTIRVAFDLAGPKLRTGPLPAGRRVVKVKPRRGVDGRVLRPAVVRFSASTIEAGRDGAAVVVPVSGALLDGARPDDEIAVRDARGRRRRAVIVRVLADAVEALLDRTAYLETGAKVVRRRAGRKVASGTIGDLPEAAAFFDVGAGETIRFRLGDAVATPARWGPDGSPVEPATISCDVAPVFDAVAPGHRILIDDGAIDAVVTSCGHGSFDVLVQRPTRAKLRAEKGINLPDTEIVAPALSPEDRLALDVIAPVADLVSLSFVRSVDDLLELRDELSARGRADVPVCVKIEHPAAFAELPHLLLHGLRTGPFAIMLARGDLAIEVGFERLAELQEEILWFCEAAHIPMIWATQVAESMAKQGQPTRAEVTDAALASRAECVMLNKGPHIVDTVRFLDDILHRMQAHQHKHTYLLRRLAVSDSLVGRAGDP